MYSTEYKNDGVSSNYVLTSLPSDTSWSDATLLECPFSKTLVCRYFVILINFGNVQFDVAFTFLRYLLYILGTN